MSAWQRLARALLRAQWVPGTLPRMALLEGKVAAITGAGQGIGRAHALLFAREGARIVVNDVGGSGTPDCLADRVVTEIREAGGTAVVHTEDISDTAGAESLVATAIDQFGQLDILVNNAGILRDKSLRKMTDTMWHQVIKVHLTGTFLCTRAAAQHMVARGEGGRIINTSSVSGLNGNFGQTNYAAAKAGIAGITRTAAIELQRNRITVNALAPIALTQMTEALPLMTGMPDAGELMSPDHIATGALFLASDLAAHLTGQILAVEGERMSVFKMTQSPAVTSMAKRWTPQEIAERWAEISESDT